MIDPNAPISKLFDAVEWEPVPKPAVVNADIGYATHKGKLTIADHEFTVYILSDGERVLDAESVEKFFEAIQMP